MQIGELARKTGVPTKTIRFYEEIGVLPEPQRIANGYRDYDDDAVDRLQFVRDAQASGLTLNEIASIIDLRRHGVGTCDHIASLLRRHLEDLDKRLKKLHHTRDQLAALTVRASSLDPADCTDPNRCQTIQGGLMDRPAADRGNHAHSAPHKHTHP